eukprot:gene14321-20306_t
MQATSSTLQWRVARPNEAVRASLTRSAFLGSRASRRVEVNQPRPRSSTLFFAAETECTPEPSTSPSLEAPPPSDYMEGDPTVPPPMDDDIPEEIFYEGSGSDNELLVSGLLGFTLIYAPLTMASIGRKLWFKLKITNKRIIVSFNSPLNKNEIQVTYDQVKDVRSIKRAFGAWGDIVVVLKNGKAIQLSGMDQVDEIKQYIERRIPDSIF